MICKKSKIWYAIVSKSDDINDDDVTLNEWNFLQQRW